MPLKPLNIQDYLDEQGFQVFNEQWEQVKASLEREISYHVHSSCPVVSQPFKFKEGVYRSKVLQKHLRKFNPYANAPYYLVPIWHPSHILVVGEQMCHSVNNRELEHYQRIAILDNNIPIVFKDKITWPKNNNNGHISVIDFFRLRGLAEKGLKLSSEYLCLVYDDENQKILGETRFPCLGRPRSYVTAFRNLQEGKPGALERIIRIIEDQDLQHKRLFTPRTDLRPNEKQELIKKSREGNLKLEDLDHFFSLYDIPKKSQ